MPRVNLENIDLGDFRSGITRLRGDVSTSVRDISIRQQENDFSTEEIINSAVRRENLIPAIDRLVNSPDFEPKEGYNPYVDDKDRIEGHRAYFDAYVDSNSPEETEYI